MNNNSLYNFYISLIPNLVTELFFYIPKDNIPSEILEEVKLFKNDTLLNKVFLFDKYKGPIYYDNDSSHKSLLIMASNHEKNIFRLIEKKSIASKIEFEFLLKKYLILVESLLYYSEWMFHNVERIFGTDNRLKGIFSLQFENFKKHFEIFVSTFYISEQSVPLCNFNTKLIIDNVFPDLAKSLSVESINDIVKEQENSTATSELFFPKQSTKVPEERQNSKNTIKKVLITEQEAEKIILQTYFGIQ